MSRLTENHATWNIEVFHFPLSDFLTHHKISDFSQISRLGVDPVRIINSESYFMKDSLKRNWWKLLCRNENVNKLCSFVDFAVPLNYNFELRSFPISGAQIVANGEKMGGIEERWEGPSKSAEFLRSAEEWHHVSSGRQEREASLLQLAESRCPKD